VTNWISSLLWISIAIFNFKSHKIIMSARDYLMKTVMSVYNVSARWTVKTDKFTLFVYILQFSCLTKYNRMQSKHKQTNCKQQTKILRITAFSEGITILNQRIFKKTISNSSLNSHFYWDTLYVNVISRVMLIRSTAHPSYCPSAILPIRPTATSDLRQL